MTTIFELDSIVSQKYILNELNWYLRKYLFPKQKLQLSYFL